MGRGLSRLPFAIDWTEWHTPKRVLVGAAMVGWRLVILADRGFRRVRWIALLQTLDLDFVSRLMTDVTAHLPEGPVSLSAIRLHPGEKIDLGSVRLAGTAHDLAHPLLFVERRDDEDHAPRRHGMHDTFVVSRLPSALSRAVPSRGDERFYKNTLQHE